MAALPSTRTLQARGDDSAKLVTQQLLWHSWASSSFKTALSHVTSVYMRAAGPASHLPVCWRLRVLRALWCTTMGTLECSTQLVNGLAHQLV